MRLTIRLLLFFLVFIASVSLVEGQASKCNGALGDPVINEDFGAGVNPGPQLGNGITNMEYTVNNCPNDGQYTISNSLTAADG